MHLYSIIYQTGKQIAHRPISIVKTSLQRVDYYIKFGTNVTAIMMKRVGIQLHINLFSTAQ